MGYGVVSIGVLVWGELVLSYRAFGGELLTFGVGVFYRLLPPFV